MGNSAHGTTYTYTETRFGFEYDCHRTEGWSSPGGFSSSASPSSVAFIIAWCGMGGYLFGMRGSAFGAQSLGLEV